MGIVVFIMSFKFNRFLNRFLIQRMLFNIFNGYQICAFPDSLDATTPDIGYMPGCLRWLLAASLEKLGVHLLNSDITGAVHVDRNVITGDSPLAANKLGLVAAKELVIRMKA